MKKFLSVILALLMPISISHAKEGDFMEKIKSFRDWASPPKNYYIPLVNADIDISKKGMKKRFTINHKHEGNYSFGIFLDNFDDNLYYVPLAKRYKLNLKLEISYHNNDNLLLSKTIETDYEPFISNDGNGFSLFTYRVPEELPGNIDLVVQVIILEPDNHLYEKYGPSKLYVKKMSDK